MSSGPARSPHSQLLNCNTIQNSLKKIRKKEKKDPPSCVQPQCDTATLPRIKPPSASFALKQE